MPVRLRYRRLSETQGEATQGQCHLGRHSRSFSSASLTLERTRGNLREEELRLAAAALLVHATAIDGEVAPEERRKLKSSAANAFRARRR